MSTRLSCVLLALAALAAPSAAQVPSPWADPADAFAFQAAAETGLELVERDFSRTVISVRGPAAVVELRCRLTLANRGSRTVRGVTLAVRSAPGLPGGKALVTAPSLSAAPGDLVSVDVSLRLVRPLPSAGEPLAEIAVDGALYADLSFRGPDAMASRRRLTLLELEARRDRERMSATLAAEGPEALRAQVLAVLERQAADSGLEVRLAGGDGRTVSPALQASMRPLELAFVDLEGAPLEVFGGSSRVAGSAAASPALEVRNRSGQAIRDFEIGWLVRDAAGRRYAAGAVPSSGRPLPPGGVGGVAEQRVFELSLRSGESFEIAGVSGYVRRVELADGAVWTPTREALEEAALLDVEPISSEESRLAAIYRGQGLQGLLNELARF